MRRPPPRRRGAGLLVAALVALALTALIVTLTRVMTRRARATGETVARLALARRQAQSALRELAAEVRRRAETPADPLHRRLRETLGAPFEALDLTPHLTGPSRRLAPRRGRRGPDEPAARRRGEIRAWSARIVAPRAFTDPVASEEYEALVELRAEAAAADPGGSAAWSQLAVYPLRLTRAGLPRPFDQATIFVGDLADLVDVAGVNGLRRQLLAEMAAARRDVDAALARVDDPPLRRRLEKVRDGIPPAAELARRAAPLPTAPAAFLGLHHLDAVGAHELDLAGRLDGHLLRARAFGALMRDPSQAPRELAARAYARVNECSQGLEAIWALPTLGRLLPHDGAAYQDLVAPAAPRLTAAYFTDRVHRRLDPAGAWFAAWREGADRLDGVIDTRPAARTLVLGGPLRGRTTLLVGPRGATLDGAGGVPGDSLTLVSLGGDVRVRGDCRAAVVMLPDPAGGPPGRLVIEAGARLVGAALMPAARAGSDALDLRGTLAVDPALRAPYPPATAARWPGRGPYVAALAPRPLFSEGRIP